MPTTKIAPRVALAKPHWPGCKHAEHGCGLACEPTAIGVEKRGRFAAHVQLGWLVIRPTVTLNRRNI